MNDEAFLTVVASGDLNAVINFLMGAVNDATVNVPAPGTVMALAAQTLPAGWLWCDGTSYLRATYPGLFAALGGTSSPWGLPDGTHFNVPDLRSMIPVGAGTLPAGGTYAVGAFGGEETHVLSASEMLNHTHHFRSLIGTTGTFPGNIDSTSGTGKMDNLGNGVQTGAAGGGLGHANMMPWLGAGYIVKQ